MTTSPILTARDEILALHSTRDGHSLWRASDALLRRCFTNHFIVCAFQFVAERPMVILRSESAPKQNSDWWHRNVTSHPIIDLIARDPDLRFTRVTDILPVEEIKQMDYYRDFMVPEGWLYSIGLFFRSGSRMIGLLGVNRTEEQGEFSEAEMGWVAELHPHLEVAFQRVAAIQAERTASLSFAKLFANVPLPTLLVSWQGDPIYFNNPARELCLRWETGDLDGPLAAKLSTARVPEEVQQACASLRADTHDACPTNNLSSKPIPFEVPHPSLPRLRASIEPTIFKPEPMADPVFLVRLDLDDPNRSSASTRISALSRLTAAEQTLARLVADGLTNREIATELGKSASTVKTQLESVFRKLDLRGRTQLATLFTHSTPATR